MGWYISRREATDQPEVARQKVLNLLRNLDELEGAEEILFSILVDSVLLVEAYRGARHQIPLLPELQQSVDALLREITIVQRTNSWVKEPARAEEVA
jgi:hypothetical protein